LYNHFPGCTCSAWRTWISGRAGAALLGSNTTAAFASTLATLAGSTANTAGTAGTQFGHTLEIAVDDVLVQQDDVTAIGTASTVTTVTAVAPIAATCARGGWFTATAAATVATSTTGTASAAVAAATTATTAIGGFNITDQVADADRQIAGCRCITTGNPV